MNTTCHCQSRLCCHNVKIINLNSNISTFKSEYLMSLVTRLTQIDSNIVRKTGILHLKIVLINGLIIKLTFNESFIRSGTSSGSSYSDLLTAELHEVRKT